MFRTAMLFWVVLLAVAIWLTSLSLIQVDDMDRLALTVIRERLPVPKGRAPSLTFHSQHREGLRRDLWITTAGNRLQTVHYSDEADLMANQSDQEFVETMNGVSCWLQETGDIQRVCELQASHAIYDYNQLTLQAHPVHLTRYQSHSRCDGNVNKPWISGDALSVDVDYQAQQLCFTGNVILTSSEGFKLVCDRVSIDQKDGHALCESLGATSSVLLKGDYTDDAGRQLPLQMQSRTVEIWMDDLRFVRQLLAKGDVRFQYGDEWVAKGSQAIFHRQSGSEDFLTGTLELTTDQGDGCLVEHVAGSRVIAQRMNLDLANQKLRLKQPRGHLRGDQAHNLKMDIAFNSEEALWDHRQQLLTLAGDVSIGDESSWTLHARDEVYLHCRVGDGKVCLRLFECQGPTEMNWGEGDRLVQCHGHVLADLDEQKLVLTSPQDPEGCIAEYQLKVEGPEGKMTSDQLTLSYRIREGQLLPTLLVAEGHVCVNRMMDDQDTQYVLCDELYYWPDGGEFLFKALPQHRVIFLDRQYDVKISAPAVKINRHPDTHKEILKGLGDVRMTLLDQEFARLRKRFMIEGQDGESKERDP